jgi:hypothetical protein
VTNLCRSDTLRLMSSIISKLGRRLPLAIAIVLQMLRNTGAAHTLTNFPAPAGYIEASHLSPAVKKMATSAMRPPAELIGVYYETNALVNVLNNGVASGQITFWKATFRGNSGSIDIAKQVHAEKYGAAKELSSEPADLRKANAKALWSHYGDAAAKFKTNAPAKIHGTLPVGMIAENANVLAISKITNLRNNNTKDGWMDDKPSVLVLGFLRIGVSRVEIAFAYPFKDAASIQTANTKFLEWLKDIESRYGLADK